MAVLYGDDEHEKRRVSSWMIFRIVLALIALPITAFAMHVDALSVVIGGVLGFATFALLMKRMRRDAPFPWKVVLASVAMQGVGYTVLGAMTGKGFFGIPRSGTQEGGVYNFKLVTEDARSMQTMSVILPCANEAMYAVNTARSIGLLTPKDVLEEIIVVDDGSTPPLEQFFKEHGQDVLDTYPIRFIRHETFTGLINAKKQGGDRARGDVLAFLDCHVLPRDYGPDKHWTDGIMKRISGNYKRVVVPSITDLDADKWEEIGRPNGVAKCYLSLDVDFRWFDSDDDYVPIMSGGLLAMSKDWWWETKGYDEGMIGWGGENIDQSLRIWLCGGEIVQATDSQVAHMWRTNDKPQTKAKYTVPEGSVNTNRYRAAMAWFDDYIEKVQEFPIFHKYAPPSKLQPPDISSITEVKESLQCKPFQWFIDRFSDIYMSAGVLPDQIFRIRDRIANLCLARRNLGKRDEHDVVAATCSNDDPMQVWHVGNRKGTECCSGLRSYNSMYCLSGGSTGEVTAVECNTFGKSNEQQVNVTLEGNVFFSRSSTCATLAASAKDVITQVPCDTKNVLKEFTRKEVSGANAQGLFQIIESTTGECLTAFTPTGRDDDFGNIELSPCVPHSPTQHFNITDTPMPGAFVIKTFENLCLDAADGKKILAYSCYDLSTKNEKQFFLFDENDRSVKNMYHPTCWAVPDSRLDLTASQLPVWLTGCIVWEGHVKAEQQFIRVPAKGDAVLIQSGEWCLSGVRDEEALVMVKCPSDPKTADDRMLWYFESLERIRNKHANKCIDGNDHKTPILYPCYANDNDNQEWIDPSSAKLLKNNRAQMCLDYHPVVERQVAVSRNCHTGAHWQIFDSHESTEMKIYKATKAKEAAPVHG